MNSQNISNIKKFKTSKPKLFYPHCISFMDLCVLPVVFRNTGIALEMADLQVNCPNDSDDGGRPPQKRQRCDKNEQEPIDAPDLQRASLTNISSNFINRIFGSLDLESLLHVAHTCKHLQVAATAKYSDVFSEREVRLFPFESRRHSQASGIRVSPLNYTEVFGLDVCFAFLRCFGGEVLKLNACYNSNEVGTQAQRNHLDRYISQYCADSLTSIIFNCKTSFSNEYFTKPFKNVTQVQIIGGQLGQQFPNFAQWFPACQDLELWYEIKIDDNATFVSFPNLTRLSIKVQGLSGYFTRENATKFLHANPQLESLTLYSDNSISRTEFSEVMDMLHPHSVVTKLKVGEFWACVNVDEAKRFTAEHPVIEELCLQDVIFSENSALIVLRNLKSLKRFDFSMKTQPECNSLVRRLGIRTWECSNILGNNILINLRKNV